MTNLHCIHGAWHGAWVWHPLMQVLSKKAYSFSAPNLPGLGDLSGELNESIDLESHIVAAVPEQRSWLVAHSYAGMLARAIVDRHPELVSGLILIEALWPLDSGSSAMDLLPEQVADTFIEQSNRLGQGWMMPPPPVAQFSIADPALEASIEKRLTPHPLATFKQPLSFKNECTPGTYLMASDRSTQPYLATAEHLANGGWNLHMLTGGHEMMLTNTSSVAALIHDAITGLSDTTESINRTEKSL